MKTTLARWLGLVAMIAGIVWFAAHPSWPPHEGPLVVGLSGMSLWWIAGYIRVAKRVHASMQDAIAELARRGIAPTHAFMSLERDAMIARGSDGLIALVDLAADGRITNVRVAEPADLSASIEVSAKGGRSLRVRDKRGLTVIVFSYATSATDSGVDELRERKIYAFAEWWRNAVTGEQTAAYDVPGSLGLFSGGSEAQPVQLPSARALPRATPAARG